VERTADHAFDRFQRIDELPAETQFQQSEPVTGAAATTDVIAATVFIGGLKPVVASTSRARLIAFTKNLSVHTQTRQDAHPATVGTALGLLNPAL
jgi:hypothetical protein